MKELNLKGMDLKIKEKSDKLKVKNGSIMTQKKKIEPNPQKKKQSL